MSVQPADHVREDIRLLGRVLDRVIAKQEGQEIFDLVESTRRAAFDISHGDAAPEDLLAVFHDMDITKMNLVARALSHFALLTNVVEDLEDEKAAAPVSLRTTFTHLKDSGVDADKVAELISGAQVAPVLTAHPTEARRRTVFDTQTHIKRLLSELRAGADPAAIEREMELRMTLMWQTALIRIARPRLEDEIDVGLRYYKLSLLEQIPALNRAIRYELRDTFDRDLALTPVMRPGSWIGGDHDGNPYVNAKTLTYATRRAADTAFSHYVDELGELERELSLSDRYPTCSEELSELADAANNTAESRVDEPYRRAIYGIRHRVAATRDQLAGEPRTGEHLPYADPGELLADLDVIDASLRARGGTIIADDRLNRLRSAVYGLIAEEFERTQQVYFRITGHTDLVAENQRQARSLKRRYPYLLPLNAVQLELLRRYRADDETFLVSKTIHVTMNRLATALRNAG